MKKIYKGNSNSHRHADSIAWSLGILQNAAPSKGKGWKKDGKGRETARMGQKNLNSLHGSLFHVSTFYRLLRFPWQNLSPGHTGHTEISVFRTVGLVVAVVAVVAVVRP
jgi:hypothetical protein